MYSGKSLLCCRNETVLMVSARSVRALGETDLNPVSAIGKISQLLFAVVQVSSIAASQVFSR